MSYTKVINRIKENKGNKYNFIPFGFDRGNKYLPGILFETYYIVTANSGVGKSRFARYYFIFRPLEFIKNNPDSDLDMKIFLFSLEESSDRFTLFLMSQWLSITHNITLDIRELLSYTEERKLTDDTIALLECQEFKDYCQYIESKVEVIDNVYNPYGIYKYQKEWLLKNGRLEKVKRIIEGVEREIEIYIPNNPSLLVLSIVDNLNLIHPEKGMTFHEAITKYSSVYSIELRNKFGMTLVNLQQQEAAKEKQEYYRGQSIHAKLEPSLDGLGDNKLTQRDSNIVLGLFSPARHEIPEWNGYDISILNNSYIQLSVLKDRDGKGNIKIPLHFDGEVGSYSELPRAKDFQLNPELYNKYK